MPVVTKQEREKLRLLDWSDLSYWGVNHLPLGKKVEPHFHDTHEYWIIVEGTGVCTTEGDTYQVGPGDLVLTKAGDEHSLVVTKEMKAVYFYGRLAPGATLGHKHRHEPGRDKS